MVWLPLLLSTLAAAPAPRAIVIPVVREGLIDPATADRVEAAVRAALEKELALMPAAEGRRVLDEASFKPEDCEGNPVCFKLAGQRASAWAVVRVEAVAVAGNLTVAVQALDSQRGEELAAEHFTVAPAALEATAAARLAPLAAKLKQRAPASPATDAPPSDAPVAAAPLPAPVPPQPPALAAAPAPKRGPGPAIALGGGALALAGAAAGFFAMGLDARACLQGPPVNGSPTVCVPQSQVAARQAQADTGLVLGSVASALATGAAITALVLLATN